MKDKIKNTEMVVTELTSNLTKVMAHNYRRLSRASGGSPIPMFEKEDTIDLNSADKTPFKRKKDSLPQKPNEQSLFNKNEVGINNRNDGLYKSRSKQ